MNSFNKQQEEYVGNVHIRNDLGTPVVRQYLLQMPDLHSGGLLTLYDISLKGCLDRIRVRRLRDFLDGENKITLANL